MQISLFLCDKDISYSNRGLTDTIIHFEHFDRNLFVKSFGSDDSWDINYQSEVGFWNFHCLEGKVYNLDL